MHRRHTHTPHLLPTLATDLISLPGKVIAAPATVGFSPPSHLPFRPSGRNLYHQSGAHGDHHGLMPFRNPSVGGADPSSGAGCGGHGEGEEFTIHQHHRRPAGDPLTAVVAFRSATEKSSQGSGSKWMHSVAASAIVSNITSIIMK